MLYENKKRAKMISIITYVLDDDQDELELLRPYLVEVCGCDLQLFTNINEFIGAIEQGVHIAIVDHQLSAGIDGIEVGIKALEKNPLLFLILFSGSASPKVWQRATNSGFRRLVDKNERNAYTIIAEMVRQEMPAIRQRINAWEGLQQLNAKYCKYLPA